MKGFHVTMYKWLKATGLVKYLPKKARLFLFIFCQNDIIKKCGTSALGKWQEKIHDFSIFGGNLRRLLNTRQVEVF